MVRGSGFGVRCRVEWMRKRKSNELKPLWMADLFPPRKGRRIGKTKVGKGTKAMIVGWKRGADRPYLDRARHHEIRLTEATLKTIRVPQKLGCLRIHPLCFGIMKSPTMKMAEP